MSESSRAERPESKLTSGSGVPSNAVHSHPNGGITVAWWGEGVSHKDIKNQGELVLPSSLLVLASESQYSHLSLHLSYLQSSRESL